MSDSPDGMDVLFLAGMLPPTDAYSTLIHNFPGNLAHPPWGLAGRFQLKVTVYEDGKEVASGESGVCDEKGTLRLDIGAVAETCGHPVRGMYILEYRHSKDIPVDVYAFHVHKETGTYISCNVLPFIGEQLFPTAHTDQMENTVFWPGVISDPDNEPHIVLVNPYAVPMGFQVHLIGKEGTVAQTGNLKQKTKTAMEYSLWRLFPDFDERLRGEGNRYSLCVSSQYKLVSYFMVRNRARGCIAMMDHLHNFCLV